MRGAARSRSSVIVVAIGLAVAAAFSCKTFNLPSDTCDPTQLHGGMLSGDLSDSTCNRCLEDHCCEQVGNCGHANGCQETVSAVHACVIDAKLMGAQREDRCARDHMLEQSPAADQAYRCMRDSCGNECGLPVCKVDPAAVLIQTPSCDACFSSSCCSELNACYANRACKLTIECIVNECGPQLGASLLAGTVSSAPLNAGGGDGDAAGFDVCAPEAAPNGPHAPACVSKCLCDYKFNDPGLAPDSDAQRPALLALAVYVCAQEAECGKECPHDLDAGGDAAPDASPDATSDAAADAH